MPYTRKAQKPIYLRLPRCCLRDQAHRLPGRIITLREYSTARLNPSDSTVSTCSGKVVQKDVFDEKPFRFLSSDFFPQLMHLCMSSTQNSYFLIGAAVFQRVLRKIYRTQRWRWRKPEASTYQNAALIIAKDLLGKFWLLLNSLLCIVYVQTSTKQRSSTKSRVSQPFAT